MLAIAGGALFLLSVVFGCIGFRSAGNLSRWYTAAVLMAAASGVSLALSREVWGGIPVIIGYFVGAFRIPEQVAGRSTGQAIERVNTALKQNRWLNAALGSLVILLEVPQQTRSDRFLFTLGVALLAVMWTVTIIEYRRSRTVRQDS